MPSFDVVSEVDKHVLTNAVDQANRLVGNRFDFKGVDAKFERNDLPDVGIVQYNLWDPDGNHIHIDFPAVE